MRKFNVGNGFKYFAAAIALLGALQIPALHAGVPTSGWVNIGPDGLGGSFFAGSGTVGALGPAPDTNPALSAGGGDIITLNSGGLAIGSGADTIILETSNDQIFNFGAIAGAAGTDLGQAGFNAIDVSASTITNDTLANHGSIAGGAGATETDTDAGAGGDGVYISAESLTSSALNNFGSIAGGSGGSVTGATASGGAGGDGIYIDASSIQNSSLLYNARGATITGGAGGSVSTSGGSGGSGGSAVFVAADSASNVGLTNAGTLMGGHGGSGGTDGRGGSGGDGIFIDPEVATGNFVINSGFISGGAPGLGGLGFGSAGSGVYYIGPDSSVINFGIITGGNGGLIEGGPNIKTKDSSPTGEAGIGVYMNGDNNSVINTGTISGGSGGDEFGSTIVKAVPTIIPFGGVGVYMEGSGGSIINGGVINGGNGEVANEPVIVPAIITPDTISLTGAPGVVVEGNNDTVVNGGIISGGVSGTATVGAIDTPDTSPIPSGRIAILMEGTGDTVVLTGHSTTNGMIVASGTTDNTNKLVINFSGVSPLEQLLLKQQLQSMGALNGVQSTGSFNFRGTTIEWDPLLIVFNPTSYQLQGLTPNQAAVGANLDSMVVNPTGDMLTLVNAIDASGDVPRALEALSPQRYQIFDDIALSSANFSTLQVDQRLNNLRDGSESIDTTGVGGDTAFSAGSDDITVAGLTKDDSKEDKHVISPMTEEKRWGFFASGDVILENYDGDKDLSSSHFTTSGLMLGLDGKVNDNWVLGTVFNYLYTSANMDNLGSTANVSSYTGGIYAGYHNGGYYGNGLLSYSRNDYDTSRAVVFPGIARAAQASTNGNQFEANLDGGYDFILCPGWTAGPIAGLQYVHLGVDDFDEFGAGAADLAVSPSDLNSLRSLLGARIEYKKQIGKEVAFAAEGRAEWQHEFLDDSRSINADFIGSGLGGFGVQTSAPQRDAALVGVGANFTIRDRMTVFTDYDVQAGQSSYFEQSISAGLKFSF